VVGEKAKRFSLENIIQLKERTIHSKPSNPDMTNTHNEMTQARRKYFYSVEAY
jgi:hypothetical protein